MNESRDPEVVEWIRNMRRTLMKMHATFQLLPDEILVPAELHKKLREYIRRTSDLLGCDLIGDEERPLLFQRIPVRVTTGNIQVIYLPKTSNPFYPKES